MRAAVYHSPGRIDVTDVPDLRAGPSELLVRVTGCGICGSDIQSWRSGAYVTEGQVLGHELAGYAEDGAEELGLERGAAVTVRPLMPCGRCVDCHRGDWQLCDRSIERGLGYGLSGGFAEMICVPWPQIGLTVFPLPDAVPVETGLLVEPLAVALHGVRRARVGVEDVVIVSGLGPIGLASVACAVAYGAAHVIGIDPSAGRRHAATQLGAVTVLDPADVVDAVRQLTGPGGFGLGAAADVVLECSGAPSAFVTAVKCLRRGGRMALVAHSTAPFAIKSGRLIEKEIDIFGAFAYRDEFPLVLDLLASGRLRVPDLVSHTLPLEDIGDAFELQADPDASLKVVVTPC